MLDNIRRKFSNPSIKDFYDRCLECGKFGDLIYYEGVICSISAERGIKKARNKSFKSFHKSSKDLSLNEIHMKMLLCPSGTFMMGHTDVWDNKPRQVMIDRAFLLGETEVTQELYQAVMGDNPSGFQNSSQNPVERVSWYDAILFCNKLSELQCFDKCYILTDISTIDKYRKIDEKRIMSAKVICDFGKNGYRLPREKEWEYAAKAGTNNEWAGTDRGTDILNYAVYAENSKIKGERQTHPVKTKRPNEWGFYDMAGNVQEWCWDKYEPENPDSDGRVLRGGGYDNYDRSLRSAVRGGNSPGDRDGYFGFRVCRSIVN